MIAASRPSREIAVSAAERWLRDLSPATREATALRDLGLLCCERVRMRAGLSARGDATRLRFPTISAFVTMDRDQTVAFCRSISASFGREVRIGAKMRRTWSEVFGSVALSCARVADASTTAILLRTSAELQLTHPWLDEAERYLLDQQNPEGCFGLFTRELALVPVDTAPWMAHLSLSVEVLWALAEVAALERKLGRNDSTVAAIAERPLPRVHYAALLAMSTATEARALT